MRTLLVILLLAAAATIDLFLFPPRGCLLRDIVSSSPHDTARNVATSDTYCRRPIP